MGFAWFPRNVSTFGADIDWVFYLIYYIVGAWFLLTEGALLVFALRYRARSGRRASAARGDTGRELAWLLVPAAIVLVLDLGIDVAGGEVWEKVKGKPPVGDLQLRVTAKQFGWSFTYPGADHRFDTADDLAADYELHVPAGKVIRLVLSSTDVIHSFFVPSLRLKQDVLPGRHIEVWFNATTPGAYEIACSELCGFGHSGMRGLLSVQSPEDYERWMAGQVREQRESDWPTVAREHRSESKAG
ncbi:MAG: cytochrome c oxidase subunit II [Gemmatimonadetes bacterium]|nr:cytochrome c oxidase subunit II [Gemmatimonadota bacterium]